MRIATLSCLILCLAAPLAAQPALGQDVAPFGAQIPWPSNESIDTYMDRLQEAGVQWARSEIIWWGLCESTPGSYEYVSPAVASWESWNADHWVDGLLARGIRPYAILAYGNAIYDPKPDNPEDWLPPTSPESRAAYAAWCCQTAARYADRVDVWEIWNEPNLAQFWGGVPASPEAYTALVASAEPRIREADPTAIVVGGAVSGIDLAYLEQCFALGLLDHVDAISIHPYRTDRPESIEDEVAQLRSLIAAHAPEGKEILLFTGEWGYNTFWSEVDEIGQAKALLRMMCNNLRLGIDLSIWFSAHAFQEADPDGADSEWGLLDRDLERRPSFQAMQTLSEHLSAPVRAIDRPFNLTVSPELEGQRILAVEHGMVEDMTLALWLDRWPVNGAFTPEEVEVLIELPMACSIRGFDGLTGEEFEVQVEGDKDGTVIRGVPMSDYPIFLEIQATE